jgi:signal transduction histidine kinase
VKSLQGRLLAVLVGTIVLCWVLSLAIQAAYLRHSRTSIWDDKLQAFATRVARAIPAIRKENFRAQGPFLELRDETPALADALVFQIWYQRTLLRNARAPGAPETALQPHFVDGFDSPIVDGRRWRVYAISDNTGAVQVQVGILHQVIDDEVRTDTLNALLVNSILLALVGALMWHTVRRSLKPVATIENLMQKRGNFDLTPLPTRALPTELRPLVESFNRLLVQLDHAVDGERRFIGDAAHELRTPLAALQAHAEIALRAPSAADKDAALGKLLTVARRTARLSDQLLDLARLNAGSHTPRQAEADLEELVVHVMNEFEVQAEQHRRTLCMEIRPGRIVCNVDEIGILLRNLIDNALRYTAPGGRVKVSCGSVAGTDGSSVYLEVSDDGPGVPPAEHRDIFRRFHRASGSGARGSGIGLSLVAGIADLHRATIRTGTGLDGRGFSVRVAFPPAPAGPA